MSPICVKTIRQKRADAEMAPFQSKATDNKRPKIAENDKISCKDEGFKELNEIDKRIRKGPIRPQKRSFFCNSISLLSTK